MASSASSDSSDTLDAQRERDQAPLPIRQFAVLLFARTVIPFVFVNQMIEDLLPDVPKESIGAYSGAIESLFALFQFLTSYHWGAISDHPRCGRKPVILASLLFLSVCILFFGTAQSYWAAAVARIACGILCGSSATSRAVLGEITPKRAEHIFYPIYATTFDVAVVIGPILGGLMANPAQQYPGTWLADIKYLQKHPYFLPCAFTSALSLLAFFAVLFGLDETLEAKIRRGKQLKDEATAPDERTALLPPEHNTADEVGPAAMTAFALLRIPTVAQMMVAFFLQVFLSLSFDSVFILFAYSSPKLAGLGLSAKGIATAMMLRGVISILFTTCAFGPLQKHFGPSRLYTFFVSCWAVCYAMPPFMNKLVLGSPDAYVSRKGTIKAALMPYIGTDMLFYALGDAQFPLAMLALNSSVSNPNILGAVNGLSSAISALGRACGPFFVNYAYALGLKNDVPVAVWLLMITLGLIAAAQTRLVSFK